MAWTPPKTWTNATLTTSDLNTHVRDNLAYLKDRCAYGSNVINFPNSQSATANNFNHGLAGTPAAVLITPVSSADTPVVFWVFSVGATQFSVDGWCISGTLNGNVAFYWVAFLA